MREFYHDGPTDDASTADMLMRISDDLVAELQNPDVEVLNFIASPSLGLVLAEALERHADYLREKIDAAQT